MSEPILLERDLAALLRFAAGLLEGGDEVLPSTRKPTAARLRAYADSIDPPEEEEEGDIAMWRRGVQERGVYTLKAASEILKTSEADLKAALAPGWCEVGDYHVEYISE